MCPRHTSSDWNKFGCQPQVSENLTTPCFGAYIAKKIYIIYNHKPSWMTVAQSINQTVTYHKDKGLKLYYSQTSLDYPDSGGLGWMARIIESADNRKYEYSWTPLTRTPITRTTPLTRTESQFPWIWTNFSVIFTRITRTPITRNPANSNRFSLPLTKVYPDNSNFWFL